MSSTNGIIAVRIERVDMAINIKEKPDIPDLTKFACSLADMAAEITLAYFRQPLGIENKLSDGDFDPVTVADREAESVMLAAIKQHYPTHGIYGEEHGAQDGSSHLTWVLDPIDGTRAFISGLPVWGTLIALFDGSEPLLGVMDQPFTRERFVSGINCTYYRHNGVETQLSTSDCCHLADAIMMSTAPDMFDPGEFTVQQTLAKQVKLMRYGGDCYAYSMLAAGHIDLVVEADLSPYDIQALIPIVKNAGGVITDWRGDTASNGGQVIAAANAALHAVALSVLQPAARKSETIL